MAKRKRTEINPLLIGAGVATAAGLGILLFRAFRRPTAVVIEGVDAARTGLVDAAQAVADSFFGVQDAQDVQDRTNQVVSTAQSLINTSMDDLERARLRLVQLEAAKAEAIALGQPVGVQPSIDIVRARIAALEAELEIAS